MEAKQDTLHEIENYAGTVKRSRYTYGVNLIAQRTDVTTAFDLGSSLTHNAGATTWKYDGLGQIVLADAPSTTADRAYEYDGIGNRNKSANSLTLPTPNNYVSNALNQYTAVDSFTPGYDSDGNQTTAQIKPLTGSLMSSIFVWDAENRKIEVKDNPTTTRVSYAYDALSRRIARIGPGGSVTLYLYDGSNCIAEYSGSSGTLALTRTWGLDLSGGKQGAGGVGGLLSEIRGSYRYYPTYDGNGNISEYLNADGTTAAHFEYDAFGNTVVITNPSGILFTYRFSTKPIELLTGLFDYGYRWYDPLTGRWPSRDPIEEEGGLNLYGFVGNDGVGAWDYLGLSKKYPLPKNCLEMASNVVWDFFKNFDREVTNAKKQENLSNKCDDYFIKEDGAQSEKTPGQRRQEHAQRALNYWGGVTNLCTAMKKVLALYEDCLRTGTTMDPLLKSAINDLLHKCKNPKGTPEAAQPGSEHNNGFRFKGEEVAPSDSEPLPVQNPASMPQRPGVQVPQSIPNIIPFPQRPSTPQNPPNVIPFPSRPPYIVRPEPAIRPWTPYITPAVRTPGSTPGTVVPKPIQRPVRGVGR
jgi:RHS repeat-associated protein